MTPVLVPGELIERQRIIDQVNSWLDDSHRRQQSPIINWHGIAGTGKSSAMRQIFQHFAQQGYNVLLLGFDSIELKKRLSQKDASAVQPLGNLLAALRRIPALADMLNLPPEGHEVYCYAATTPTGESEDFRYQAGQPLLLLLDGLDDLPIWKWLQGELIAPLIEEQESMVICTSQSPLFWDFWELRDACIVEEFLAFDREEIESYLRLRGLRNIKWLSEEILTFTGGYPLAVCEFAEKALPPKAKEWAYPEGKFTPEERAWLDQIGTLRLAEAETINELLKDTPTPPPSALKIMQLRKKLEDERLLLRLNQHTPDRLHKELRTQIEQQLRATNQEQQLRRTWQKLSNHYYQRFLDAPKTVPFTCLEWLYFETKLLLETQNNDLVAQSRAPDTHELLDKLHTAIDTAIAVNRAVIRSAPNYDENPGDGTLPVLFYKDYELIENLMDLSAPTDDQSGDQLCDSSDEEQSPDTLFDRVEREMQRYLREVSVQLSVRAQTSTYESLDSGQLSGIELKVRSLRVELDATCGTVLKALSDRLPTEQLPPSLKNGKDLGMSIQQLLLRPDEGFDLPTLRQRVVRLIEIAPHEVDRMLDVLNSRGLLVYDRPTQTFSFNGMIRHLIRFSEERAAPKTSYVQTVSAR